MRHLLRGAEKSLAPILSEVHAAELAVSGIEGVVLDAGG